ncbi:MAG: T9SS type A sorting domain-containing protein [Saprospiraceae bacterium]|nr:T9SS type A sorting domain-containing protein [Candidatus Defluviibacterium haderslevense]
MKKLIIICFIFHFQFGLANITATFVDKNNNDPTTGQITITVSGCSPYEYTIKGMTTNTVIYGALGPNQPFTRTHYSLPADMYEIEAYSADECRSILKGEIKNCNSISTTLQIPFVCNGQKATVTAIPSGGIQPYDFKWYKNNLRIDIYPFGSVQKLEAGFYYIVITDAIGCEFRKDFEVKSFVLNYQMEKQEYFCFTQNKITIQIKDAKNRRFNYSWSDGMNSDGSDIYMRYVNNNVNNTVTVTDLITNCTSVKTYLSTFSTNFTYWEYPIFHSIKHDVNNNNKGEVIILLKDVKFIGSNFYVNIFKNGNSYGPTLGLFNRLANISNLGVGDYCFDILDAKRCIITQLCQKIETCGEPGLPVKMTVDFQLPRWKPDAYIKANVINSGGLCTYSWFVNDYYRIYTTSNTIYASDISKLEYAGEDICVVAHCPCGETSKICVKYDPCDNSESKKSVNYINKSVPTVCYKDLPDGNRKTIKSNQSIILDIDLTRKFSYNPLQGLQIYDYRLKNVYWSDQHVLNKSVDLNRKILHIERLIDEDIPISKTFNLIFIDGNGCISIESYEVKNTMEVTNLGDCSYSVKCDGGTPEFEYNKIFTIIDGDNCIAETSCGPNKDSPLRYGNRVKGELMGTDKNMPGNCFYYEYCIWNEYNHSENHKIYDVSKNPEFTSRWDQSGFFQYAFVKRYPNYTSVPCCNPNPEVQLSKEEVVNRLILWNKDENNWTNQTSDDALNPCIAIYKCPNGYFTKIIGQNIGSYFCRIGTDCFEFTHCIFDVGGHHFDNTDSYGEDNILIFEYPNLVVKKLSTIPCPTNTPICPISPISNPIVRNIGTNSCNVMENPFTSEIKIQCTAKETKLPISIELFDIVGRSIYTRKLFSSTRDLQMNIPTAHLTSGVYFIKINMGLDSYIEKLIKQN